MKHFLTFSLFVLSSIAYCQEINQQDSTKDENLSLPLNQPLRAINPLYFIDNREVSAVDLQKIKPEEMSMINVYKDSTAIAQYGERGRNGVVVLRLRDNAKTSEHKKRSPKK